MGRIVELTNKVIVFTFEGDNFSNMFVKSIVAIVAIEVIAQAIIGAASIF